MASVDDTTVLGEDDLQDVISAVTDLTGRWKDLGISLGVRPSDLETILSNNPHSSSNCLREMLLQWLKQSYNVRTTVIYFTPLCLINLHLYKTSTSLVTIKDQGNVITIIIEEIDIQPGFEFDFS